MRDKEVFMREMNGYEFRDLIDKVHEIEQRMVEIGYELWGDVPTEDVKKVDIYSLFEPLLRILEK